MMLKIDTHAHILPEKLPNFADKLGYEDFIHLIHHSDGSANMMQGDKFFRKIQSNCWDPELRIVEYAKFDTHIQVVSTIPVMFSYWAKPKNCKALSEYLNDHIAVLCNNYPKHYLGLGTVPMQDTGEAIKELERCKEIGLVGIQIGSNINDKNLSEPEFFPVFQACEELTMAVMVHPWNMMGIESMSKYWLPWLVGMPAEVSRAACSMIFGGVFERLPQLRVCFSHGGGSFLSTIGRIEHGFNCRPDLVAIHNNVNPRAYIGDFWVDCITHDPKMLQYILNMQGSRRVTLGSDYPFPLGDPKIGQFITQMDLSEEMVEDIFCNSALEWLNIDKSRFAIDEVHTEAKWVHKKP